MGLGLGFGLANQLRSAARQRDEPTTATDSRARERLEVIARLSANQPRPPPAPAAAAAPAAPARTVERMATSATTPTSCSTCTQATLCRRASASRARSSRACSCGMTAWLEA